MSALKRAENSQSVPKYFKTIQFVMSKDEGVQRGNWKNWWEFLFSVVGSLVGLGNIWRFPYICYKNGGGLYIITMIDYFNYKGNSTMYNTK